MCTLLSIMSARIAQALLADTPAGAAVTGGAADEHDDQRRAIHVRLAPRPVGGVAVASAERPCSASAWQPLQRRCD
jgi:hypothetical protein